MTTCTECKKQIESDEDCFHIEIICGTGNDPQTGEIASQKKLCEDCFSMGDYL